MNLAKFYDFKLMNSYQFIAVVGLIMSAGAHVILWLNHKPIETYWALYLCWTVLYIIGSYLNFNSKPGEDHHHHHQH